MAHKEQFMALVEPDTLSRLDALRIVMGISRARVAEHAMTHKGLRGLELEYTERLARLQELARRQDVTWQDYVRDYAAANSRKTYGATLEDLEHQAGILRT